MLSVIISAFESYILLEKIEKLKDNMNDESWEQNIMSRPEIKNLAPVLDYSSNPIIIYYNVK